VLTLWDHFGASVGPDHRETGVLAFHRRVYRGGRGVRSDTEVGPMVPRGLLAPSQGERREVWACAVISQVAPSLVLMRERKPCCNRRCQVVGYRCLRWSWWSPSVRSRAPTHATSDGRIRPEGRQCLDRLPATASSAFFPCREGAAFLAGQKSRLTPSSALLRA